VQSIETAHTSARERHDVYTLNTSVKVTSESAPEQNCLPHMLHAQKKVTCDVLETMATP
jgi:hypothetical protein